jgi:hypothetical protein
LLQALHDQSQDVPDQPPRGYHIMGGGSLNIQANDMDLGFTEGIVSSGPYENPALAQYDLGGADVSLKLAGNLSMYSSSIQSLYGGKIDVECGGTIDLGTQATMGKSLYARGIFSAAKSDVSVIANGDINIAGSRIATYGGGDLTIKSLEGNINAGSGGLGYVDVPAIKIDPATKEMTSTLQPVPGSGIIAASLPQYGVPVGNITVETPHGDIIANAGGISQFNYNRANALGSSITLSAGERDAQGNVTHVGNIDTSNSGVVGQNVTMKATGDIKGLVVAKMNIDITARENVNVSALAQGNVNVNAGKSVSGTVIGGGNIEAKGSSIDAALMSKSVSTSGDASASQIGFAQTAVATTTSQASQPKEVTAESKKPSLATAEEDDEKKRAVKKPALTSYVGKVTVVLPSK